MGKERYLGHLTVFGIVAPRSSRIGSLVCLEAGAAKQTSWSAIEIKWNFIGDSMWSVSLATL